MKKLMPVLLLAVFSLFSLSSVKAAPVASKQVAAAKTLAKASGHWEYWCVYNEETGEFDIVAVWVEDDES